LKVWALVLHQYIQHCAAITALRDGKSTTKPVVTMSFQNKDGVKCITPKENAEVLKKYLDGVFNKASVFDQAAIDKVRQRPKDKFAWFDDPPTADEIEAAVKKLGMDKSGADARVPAEYYKALAADPETKLYLPSLIDDYWKSGSWKEPTPPPDKRVRKTTEKFEQFQKETQKLTIAARIQLAKRENWSISFVAHNPRMQKTKVFERFANYSKSSTISEALGNGATLPDLKTDLEKDWLTLHVPPLDATIEVEAEDHNTDKDGLQYEEWLVARLKLLPKKGDLSKCNNWRGICLLDIASKVMSSVIVARMSLIQEHEGLEEQTGFRSQRGTIDGSFSANIGLQKRREHGLPTWALFIDLVKAFDTVSREALFQILAKFGMPAHFINIVIRLHTNAVIKLKVGDIEVEVSSTIGVRQGSCEGPALFLFIMQACIETAEWPVAKPKFCTTEIGPITGAKSNRIRHVTEFEFWNSLFADDCEIQFNTREDMIIGANYLFYHLQKFGLQMHIGRGDGASKTEAVYFPGSRESDVSADTSNFAVADGFVSFTSEFKYLGSIIHNSLTSDADVNKRLTSASAAFGALRSCFFSNKEIKNKDKGTVYVALVLSVLLYGSECWCLTEKLYNKLRVFHNSCARAMCRINMRHTIRHHITTKSLFLRLHIQPLDHYYNTRLLRWAGHVARMPMQRLPRRLLTGWVKHKRPVGGVRMTFGRTLNKALVSAGLSVDFDTWCKTAQDRIKWRARINKIKKH
jgi:hypothetical protein